GGPGDRRRRGPLGLAALPQDRRRHADGGGGGRREGRVGRRLVELSRRAALPAALGGVSEVSVVLAFLRSRAGMALAGALVLSLALGIATWRVYAWGYGEAERAAGLAAARLEAQRLLVLRGQELRTA